MSRLRKLNASAMSRRSLWRDRRAAVAAVAALMMAFPLVIAGGMAVDCGRIIHARGLLQDAADDAALAGAIIFSSQDPKIQGNLQKNVRQTVADVFSALRLPGDVQLEPSYPVATPAIITGGQPRNSVKVTVKARVAMTILSRILGQQELIVTATAINPFNYVHIQPNTTTLNSISGNWNSIYAYPVPMTGSSADANGAGHPSGEARPSPPDIRNPNLQEMVDNCGASFWPPLASCNPANGHPNTQGAFYDGVHRNLLVSASQPISFIMKTVTGYLAKNGNGPSGPPSQYGDSYGTVGIFMTSSYLLGESPSFFSNWYLDPTNNSTTGIQQGAQHTFYPAVKNCSLQAEIAGFATFPPAGRGACTDVRSRQAGYGLSVLTCDQMRHNVFQHYWNDMGSGPIGYDDKDYNDAVYNVSCQVVPNGNPTSVVLTQ